jgi:hypothetical protein
MGRRTAILLQIMIFVVSAGTIGAAALSKEEKNLNKEMARLDRTASTPDGEIAVVKRIGSDFKVSAAQVQALRSRNLGYGEIVVVYSLAGAMSGGLTEAGVEQVLAIRQGPPVKGWGQVAEQLNRKLGSSVSRLKKVNDASHRDRKKDHAAGGSTPQRQEPDAVQDPPSRRQFSGEGKDLTRGSAAQ